MAKRQRKRSQCKTTAYRDQRMQELRDILNSRVPQRVREIIASGKADDETWLIAQLKEAKSVDPKTLFDQGRSEEWLQCVTEIFAVLSFVPGGSTAALGVKFLGMEFDAAKIAMEK